MNRIIIILSLLITSLIIFSCGNTPDAGDKHKQLEALEAQASELNLQIATLRDELGDDSTRSLNSQGSVAVAIKVVSPERFEHFIEVAGSLEAVSEAYISPEMGGRIKQVLVKEGDRVSKGQVLARLNSDVTESSIRGVKAQLELATAIFNKQNELWKQKIGSEVDFLQARIGKETLESQLQTMEAQLDMSVIRSPINGVVEDVNQKEGELAAPGMPMMRVINLDEMYIKADVAETHLPAINVKDPVYVSFPSWPNLEMRPSIHRIGNAIHALNRTLTVQVKVKNTSDRKLRPNLMANIKFMDFGSDTAILVPSICIKQDLKGQYLYVAEGEANAMKAKKVYIGTGLTYKNTTMVTRGLEEGQRVIVEGYNLVTDGTEVRL